MNTDDTIVDAAVVVEPTTEAAPEVEVTPEAAPEVTPAA